MKCFSTFYYQQECSILGGSWGARSGLWRSTWTQNRVAGHLSDGDITGLNWNQKWARIEDSKPRHKVPGWVDEEIITNQLTVLNALASFLYNSMLGKLRATMGYYSLNTPMMLSSQISTWCHFWSFFTSLLIFTWWILYLNLSICLPWESDSGTLHVAGMKAEALPPDILLRGFVIRTLASLLPSVLSLFSRVWLQPHGL